MNVADDDDDDNAATMSLPWGSLLGVCRCYVRVKIQNKFLSMHPSVNLTLVIFSLFFKARVSPQETCPLLSLTAWRLERFSTPAESPTPRIHICQRNRSVIQLTANAWHGLPLIIHPPCQQGRGGPHSLRASDWAASIHVFPARDPFPSRD